MVHFANFLDFSVGMGAKDLTRWVAQSEGRGMGRVALPWSRVWQRQGRGGFHIGGRLMSHRMKTLMCLSVLAVLALLPGAAAAEVIIDWVTVGDAGNAADTEVMTDGTTGYGRVDSVYWIGKYEVTNAQYAEFLNAVDPAGTNPYELYNFLMGGPTFGGIEFAPAAPKGSKYSLRPGRGNRPIYYVSFWDGCRFANWLHNGQGSGDTETGAYTLGGVTYPPNETVTRNPGARVFIPSEDEWYKAAYYKGGGLDAGYWDYATQSDTPPITEFPPGGNNSGNYDYVVKDLTNVGAYVDSPSPYGTFDQNGNLWEWNETIILGARRGRRGGSFHSGPPNDLHASFRYNSPGPLEAAPNIGFRVASIPEPSTVALLLVAAVLVLLWRTRN